MVNSILTDRINMMINWVRPSTTLNHSGKRANKRMSYRNQWIVESTLRLIYPKLIKTKDNPIRAWLKSIKLINGMKNHQRKMNRSKWCQRINGTSWCNTIMRSISKSKQWNINNRLRSSLNLGKNWINSWRKEEKSQRQRLDIRRYWKLKC
jgi:hypothetical protein